MEFSIQLLIWTKTQNVRASLVHVKIKDFCGLKFSVINYLPI